jgi:hypothetical protein
MKNTITELNEMCRLTNSVMRKVRTNNGFKWIMVKGHYDNDNYNVFCNGVVTKQ